MSEASNDRRRPTSLSAETRSSESRNSTCRPVAAANPGDLVLMDNLQVMHRGMGGYGDHPRLLYRCQARVPVSG